MSTAPTGSRSAWVVGVAAIAALSLVLHAPGLAEGPTLDAAVFTVVADGLRQGALPYRDLWDHKPPGIYVLFAAAQTLLPFADPWAAVWAFSVAVTAGIGIVVMFLTARLGPAPSVFWALVAVFYVGVYPVALGGGQTEPAATLLAVLALAAATISRPTLAGLLVGVGIIVSFQVAAAGFGILVAVALEAARRSRVRAVALYVGGSLALPGLAVVAAFAVGIAEPAISAVFTYNGAYSGLNRSELMVVVLGVHAVLMVLLATPLLVFGLPTAARAVRRFEDPLTAGASLWFAGWVLLVVLQGRLEPHYFVVAAPALVLLAAHRRLARAATGRLGFATAGLLVATTIVMAAAGLSPLLSRYSASWNDTSMKAATAVLRSRVPAGGSLFVWGNEPELYLASGLRPATPYVYVLPLMTPGYVDRARIEKMIEDLERSRPAFIVDAGSAAPGEPGIVPLLVQRQVLADAGREVDMIEPLRSFVRGHYGPPIEAGGWLLYPAN